MKYYLKHLKIDPMQNMVSKRINNEELITIVDLNVYNTEKLNSAIKFLLILVLTDMICVTCFA